MLTMFFFYGAFGLLALRFALGAIFLVHGWSKLKDLKGTGQWMGGGGFRPGMFWATIVAVLEFFGGGFGFILGIFVQPIAALLALQFIVIIIWRLKTHQKFVGGWEIDLLVFGALIALLFLGSGMYGLDRFFILG